MLAVVLEDVSELHRGTGCVALGHQGHRVLEMPLSLRLGILAGRKQAENAGKDEEFQPSVKAHGADSQNDGNEKGNRGGCLTRRAMLEKGLDAQPGLVTLCDATPDGARGLSSPCRAAPRRLSAPGCADR